jgi:hypothetical protein
MGRLFEATVLAAVGISGCSIAAEPKENVLTNEEPLAVVGSQNTTSGAAKSLPMAVREPQQLSAEHAQQFFGRTVTPPGPVPDVNAALAAIENPPAGSAMADLVRDYLRAVAQLPIDQQPNARQRLHDYFASKGGASSPNTAELGGRP